MIARVNIGGHIKKRPICELCGEVILNRRLHSKYHRDCHDKFRQLRALMKTKEKDPKPWHKVWFVNQLNNLKKKMVVAHSIQF